MNGNTRSIGCPSAGHFTLQPETNSCRPTMTAHKAPCQGRSTKSSSKVARAHSQKMTAPPQDNASRNRLQYCQGHGNPGAEQIVEAAALTTSAALNRETVLWPRSRSNTPAISKDN